jgi:hypothetical protein
VSPGSANATAKSLDSNASGKISGAAGGALLIAGGADGGVGCGAGGGGGAGAGAGVRAGRETGGGLGFGLVRAPQPANASAADANSKLATASRMPAEVCELLVPAMAGIIIGPIGSARTRDHHRTGNTF